MANPNLERLKSTKGGIDEIQVRPLPELPPRFLERYPEMAGWFAALELWRQSLMSELNTKISSIKSGGG